MKKSSSVQQEVFFKTIYLVHPFQAAFKRAPLQEERFERNKNELRQCQSCDAFVSFAKFILRNKPTIIYAKVCTDLHATLNAI